MQAVLGRGAWGVVREGLLAKAGGGGPDDRVPVAVKGWPQARPQRIPLRTSPFLPARSSRPL